MGGLQVSVIALLLLLSPLLAYSDSLAETSTNSGSPSPCCAIFQKQTSLASKVFMPNTAPYKEQEATYYNSENINLKPACRVSPTTAADVSLIIKLATKSACKFAVRSKGHMNWIGASNIGTTGFTIDMQKMNQITLASNKSMVSLGPGSSWGQVYAKLDPLGVTALGGRTSGVGVGGLLLGGGISFLSAEHGFASDNVLNYEIVLADGSIVNANAHSNKDLYIALKYGSTNYGVVTRFDVTAFPLGKVWGGSLFFNKSDGFALLETLKDFSNQLSKDPKGLSAVSFAYSAAAKDYIIWSCNVYLKPVAFPSPLFNQISKFTPFASTMRIATQQNITDEVEQLFGSGARARWFTLSLKIDSQIMFDIYTKGAAMFKPLEKKAGFSSAFTIQPMSKSMVAASSRNGGNLMGMSTSNGNLLLLLAALFWTDPADDKLFNDTFNQFTVWAQAEATKRGFMTNFLYMNYALGSQDILNSIGSANEAKMVKVQKQYDPQNLLGKYWIGGYKLNCD
ncbi:hypothetical protein C8J57DRAFT_677911 [Mycena rebaudengoi]|nr:hypothetical protein C8J57DRAFT_677911 [Mycena rebaudengoi]